MIISRDTRVLSDLYEVINEAKELDLSMFGPPPPRAKFKTGEFVTVRDGGKFKSYHTKRHLPYNNKAGEIVGYFNYPGAFTKYTVKFNDGTILPIHSNFLIGPFKTAAIAREYEDVTKEIVPEDILQPGGRPVLEQWETNERFEKEAKALLTQEPYNFQWHDTSIEILKEYGNVTFELARRGNYILKRENKINNRKLTTGVYGGYILTLPPDYCKGIVENSYIDNILVRKNARAQDEIYYRPKDLKHLQAPDTKNRYKINFELQQTEGMNNEILLKLLSPYLEETGDGYKLLVHSLKPFTYDPSVLKNCSVLDNITVVGDAFAWFAYGTPNPTLVRSPKEIDGNFSCNISPVNFRGMPIVTGSVKFSDPEDTKRYIEYLANTSYKHPDLKDYLDF